MIKIAHRGNLLGRNQEKENTVQYIKDALALGYHVEIDIRYINGTFFLGHDFPQEEVTEEFLENSYIIAHAKNIEALIMMLKNKKIHCFWHEGDQFTITSNRWIWKYPEVYYDGKLIAKCSDNPGIKNNL